MAPQYLQDLLKPCFPSQTIYSLRNYDGLSFVIPQARTASYLKRFFLPSTINLWNDLPLHIKSLPTLFSFTNAIKHLFYRKPIKLFNHGNRCVNIIHCQLRNSASNLNADLYKDFIIDNYM